MGTFYAKNMDGVKSSLYDYAVTRSRYYAVIVLQISSIRPY
jgi:hypothetical protein